MPRGAVAAMQVATIIWCYPAQALDVVPAPQQAEPLHTVSEGTWGDLAQVGLGTVGYFHPAAKAGATAVKLEKEGLEVVGEAISGRTHKIEGELLLIDRDAKRLEEIRREGRNLRSDPEAKELLDAMSGRIRPGDGPYSFAAKSIFSTQGLYAAAVVTGRSWVTNKVAGAITKKLGVGPFTADAIRGSRWGRLKIVSNLSRRLTDDLTKVFLKKVAKAVFDEVLAEKLKEIESLVAQRSQGTYRRVSGMSLRLAMIQSPEIVLPTVVEPLEFQGIAEPLVLEEPAQLEVYTDRVVNAIRVERQVIDAQNYTVNYSDTTVRSAPVEHPLRSSGPSFDTSHFFRGGFDSAGGSLWGR